jgi:PIN domain nuclease of toxin-antitoxin system
VTALLVDTQVFLWMQTAPERLGSARPLIEDEGTELFLSAASSWEIAIKWALDKLPLPEPPDRYVPDRMQRSAMTALAVSHHHALAVAELPTHHRDPFDRLLVAQATSEGLPLITADAALRPYDIEIVWIGP